MDLYELKREQKKLAGRIRLQDSFTKIKTIGGADCAHVKNKLLACVVVLEFPSLKLIEKQTAVLHDPLPYRPGFLAYREMPAIIEAFNKLEQEPDVLLVDGLGILHPRKLGIASHLGLALNIPTIGIASKVPTNVPSDNKNKNDKNKNNTNDGHNIEKGKIYLDGDFVGFELKTKEHANPIYVSPGQNVSLGTALQIARETIKLPHKLPEPIHLANRIAKKKVKKIE